jgi:hypothetical protein
MSDRAMKIGTTVHLVDARGCHRLHVIAGGDRVQGDTLRLAGQMWRELVFRFGGESDSVHRPIARSDRPAIGPSDDKYRSIYLPFGWTPPAQHVGRR